MMAHGAGVTAPTAHNVVREILPPTFTAVDERRFESEIKRIDTTLADERKNREKFETRIEKSVNDMRGEMNARFDKVEKSADARFIKVDSDFRDMRGEMNARFDKMEKSVDARFEKVDSDFRDMRGEMNARFDKMEKSVDARFEKVDSDFRDMRGEMFAGFDKLNGKMDSLFRWMIGFLVGAVLIPVALQYFVK
jgi:chromosome segregation ATPase